MKAVILLVLSIVAIASASFYRLGNHVGPNTPAAFGFKLCGLGSAYINGKTTGPSAGRIGFGADLATTSINLADQGLCSGVWNGKRAFDDDDIPATRTSDVATVPADTTASFAIYWSSAANAVPDSLTTQVVDGGVMYPLNANSNVQITGPITTSDGIVDYPTATFSFTGDNKYITQEWYYHATGAVCINSNNNHGNQITEYYAAPAGSTAASVEALQLKSRIRFNINAGATINEFVEASIGYSASSNQFYTTLRTDGSSYTPSFATVSYRLIDSNNNQYICTGSQCTTTTASTGSSVQNCVSADWKRDASKPLASN